MKLKTLAIRSSTSRKKTATAMYTTTLSIKELKELSVDVVPLAIETKEEFLNLTKTPIGITIDKNSDVEWNEIRLTYDRFCEDSDDDYYQCGLLFFNGRPKVESYQDVIRLQKILSLEEDTYVQVSFTAK